MGLPRDSGVHVECCLWRVPGISVVWATTSAGNSVGSRKAWMTKRETPSTGPAEGGATAGGAATPKTDGAAAQTQKLVLSVTRTRAVGLLNGGSNDGRKCWNKPWDQILVELLPRRGREKTLGETHEEGLVRSRGCRPRDDEGFLNNV